MKIYTYRDSNPEISHSVGERLIHWAIGAKGDLGNNAPHWDSNPEISRRAGERLIHWAMGTNLHLLEKKYAINPPYLQTSNHIKVGGML